MKRHWILGAILMVALGATLGIHSQALAATTDHVFVVSSFFDIDYGDGLGTVHTQSNGTSVVRVSDPVGGTSSFPTEMLSLDLRSLMSMIRESPTRASQGQLRIPSIGDPDFDLLRVHSFFDVFTELSLDGGQTWPPSTQAAHFSGASDSFFDITYRLDNDVEVLGTPGHVTVLKAGSTMHMTQVVPEPSSIVVLLTGIAGLAGFGMRRRNR